MFFSNSLENQLKRWNDIIHNQPQDPKAYIQRGMVNFKLAKIDESIQDFDIAEQLDVRLKPYKAINYETPQLPILAVG
jgi:hypothetical protein